MKNGNAKVFIVEDDEVTSLSIEHAVKSVAGEDVQIFRFESVERAVANKAELPSIIVLDHFLKHANGIDAIPILKELFPQAAIAVMSGQYNISNKTKAYGLGVKTYIQKGPGSLEEIKEFVKTYLGEQPKRGFFSRFFARRA